MYTKQVRVDTHNFIYDCIVQLNYLSVLEFISGTS